MKIIKTLTAALLLYAPSFVIAQETSIKINFGPPPAMVDLSAHPYLDAAQRFADAMSEYGVDATGEFYKHIDIPGKTGLTLGDPNVDQDVYRLFWLLTEVSGDPKYRAIADRGARAFLRNRSQQSGSGIITWAEGGGSVNCENDQFPVIQDDLWRLEPLRMLIAAHDYWTNGIGNKDTGDFDRHCSSTAVGVPFARHGGAMINLWMEAFKRTHDQDHLDRAMLLTDFYDGLMSNNTYNYWTGPVEMVMLQGMASNMNAHALLSSETERDRLLDYAKRNSQTQVTNDIWGRRQLHAHAIMANRYYQLMDAGETELAASFEAALIRLINEEYAVVSGSEIEDQSKDVGAAILTILAAYKISNDADLLALAQTWADHGLTTFMTDTDLPPLVAGGTEYGRFSGGSNGGNTPSTLPLGLLLLGMELAHPERRLLIINASF